MYDLLVVGMDGQVHTPSSLPTNRRANAARAKPAANIT